MSLGSCCVSGAKHDGTPVGSIKQIGGVTTYVSLPTDEFDKSTAVLFLPDVFGLELPNAKLLADSFAANGFATYIPDYFNGTALPADALNDGTFDIMAWLGTHGQDVTRPILDKFIAGLKADGITNFGATGYCFGGRYVADLAISNEIKVAVVAHPSLLKVPDDLEAIKASFKGPFLWNVAEKDYMFTYAAADAADKVFGDSKNCTQHSSKPRTGRGFIDIILPFADKRIDYPGCDHGFAVRADLTKPEVKEGKEKCFDETIKFFKANL
ncbi:hypothetical protein P7C70_g7099, partial [Phenoliferia sp. Uapishka_3]